MGSRGRHAGSVLPGRLAAAGGVRSDTPEPFELAFGALAILP